MSPTTNLPPSFRKFDGLPEAAMEAWAPGAKLVIIKSLGGLSGAGVFKVDISGGVIEPGQYILKLYEVAEWEDEATEEERHRRVCDRNNDFARSHIPRLVNHFRKVGGGSGDPDQIALLYEIAGLSLERYQTVDTPSATTGTVERTCGELFRDLLEEWSDDAPSTPVSPRAILQEWLGYRIQPEAGKGLHHFVRAELGTASEVVLAHEMLVNPLWFCTSCEAIDESPDVCLRGLLHGDLHPGNVLTYRTAPDKTPYWIIDFALSRDAPIGYDHAYFEVGYILKILAESGPEQMIGLLKALEVPADQEELPPQNIGLARTLRTIRESLARWQETAQPRRFDPLRRQFALARIAAGLNWANKAKLDLTRRRLALYYAAWCARRYWQEHHPGIWESYSAPASATERTAPEEQLPSRCANEKLWSEVWERAEHFNPNTGKYILIAEALGERVGIESLGLLPWSLVIDLDEKSDGYGLYHKAGPILDIRRSLNTFALDLIPTDFDRGTAWMMAGGWARKSFSKPGYDD